MWKKYEEKMKEYLRKKREDRDSKLIGKTSTLQQDARQYSTNMASKTSSTLTIQSGEPDVGQTKHLGKKNTRNLARDSQKQWTVIIGCIRTIQQNTANSIEFNKCINIFVAAFYISTRDRQLNYSGRTTPQFDKTRRQYFNCKDLVKYITQKWKLAILLPCATNCPTNIKCI